MGCFSFCSSKSSSPMKNSSLEIPCENLEPKHVKHEVLLRIPACKVHLMDDGEAIELANGEFKLIKLMEDNFSLATIISIGQEQQHGDHDDLLQWPLTKDEPVVKLDSLHYLFSLPMQDGDPPLSYGLTFSDQYGNSLSSLDSFLMENSCFNSTSSLSSSSCASRNRKIDWKEYAPRIDDYNNVLAKAIAGGTGQIVKGIFKCSNSYTNKVNKGGEMILTFIPEDNKAAYHRENEAIKSANITRKKSGINQSLKRVRKLSKMTEKLSKTMLNVVGLATGSVMAPVLKSQPGKAFFAMVPGEVLLASLDAVNKILDAAEAAEKQAFSATSHATTRMVSNRFGESAGEATHDVLATAGHFAGTAWNVLKLRKAINPASSVSTGVLKNASSLRNNKMSQHN